MVVCFPSLQFSSKWQGLQSLRDKKDSSNARKGKEVEIKEEELFTVERTPLFYNQAPGHYQQNPESKRIKHTSVVEEAIHFFLKGLSFSNKIKNVVFDAPGDVNCTLPGCTNLMSNIQRLPRGEHVCKKKT